MKELFIQIVNMSITASWLVFVIALIRLVFKKAPKSMICFLWLFVAIRLIVPFSFESALSLIPSTERTVHDFAGIEPSVPTINVHGHSGVQEGAPNQGHEQSPSIEESDKMSFEVIEFLPWLWISGILCMAGYAAHSTYQIRKRVDASTETEENIWICDDLSSPFILGVFHPRIYLPSYLSEAEKKYVMAHEKAHLKRMDHWWKPLGYALLSVYWFNPVMWAAYVLLCSDIELACDEKVIKTLGEENKVDYSKVLLSCSVPRTMILACPLAFGEVSVKQRIRTVLNYKKPAFWVLTAALLICLAIPVFFLSNPKPVSMKELNEFYEMMMEEETNATVWSMIPVNDYHSEKDKDQGMDYIKLQYTGFQLAIEEREQFTRLFEILDSKTEVIESNLNEDIYYDQTFAFELKTKESKHQLRVYRDGTVLIVNDENSYMYELDDEKLQQVREYYGEFLLKYSKAKDKQEYVDEVLLNEKREIISAYRIAVRQTDYLGLQIYGSRDDQYVTDLKPVLLNYEKKKDDVGLSGLSIGEKVENNRRPQEIVVCKEMTKEACKIDMIDQEQYYLVANLISYADKDDMNGDVINQIMEYDSSYFNVSQHLQNITLKTFEGVISNLTKSGSSYEIQLKNALFGSLNVLASEEEVKNLQEGDALRVVYQQEETNQLLAAEKFKTKTGKFVLEVFSDSSKGNKDIAFESENYRNSFMIYNVPSKQFGYKTGDVVEVCYYEKKVPTADSNKFSLDYILVSMEKTGGLYENPLTLREILGFDPVKIKLVQPGWMVEDPDTIIELYSEDATAFMQRMNQIPAYKDFVRQFGAGALIYRAYFTSADGQEVMMKFEFNIEATMPDGTVIEYGHARDASDQYYFVVESYFR